MDKFNIGDNVNVKYKSGDLFNHDFTGHVKGFRGDYVLVEDQDGDVFEVGSEQVSFCSDEIMHG